MRMSTMRPVSLVFESKLYPVFARNLLLRPAQPRLARDAHRHLEPSPFLAVQCGQRHQAHKHRDTVLIVPSQHQEVFTVLETYDFRPHKVRGVSLKRILWKLDGVIEQIGSAILWSSLF